MEEFTILKVKGNQIEEAVDALIEEVPLTIVINDQELATFLCTPFDLEDLVTGFLFSSGLIKGAAEISELLVVEDKWTAYVTIKGFEGRAELLFKRLYTSGCGKGIQFYNVTDLLNRAPIVCPLKWKTAYISHLMKMFQERSELFKKTGGAHSAALTNDGEMLIFKEDIGRHNAIDKVIGHALTAGLTFFDKLLITSGRVSSEVLFKIQKCRIPVIISRSAPTNQAVKLAKDMDLTLVGFARGQSMNIYSRSDRIETPAKST